MRKIKTILIAIVIIAIVVIVVIVAIKSGKQNGTNNTNNNDSLKNVEIASEFYGFSATIKNIDGKTLTLEGSIPAASGEPVTETVKVSVTDETKIVKLKFPTETEDKTKPVYPEEIVLKFSDLKIGDKIDISSVENIAENIKTDKPIIVNNIFITEQ
jgi:uncharacterized membrane protein